MTKSTFGIDSLPIRVRQRLGEIAERYGPEGIELFVFGSFARGDSRPGSDLDLGVEWTGHPSPSTFQRLQREIDTLPTIRKIDLVDFAEAGERFRSVAGQKRISLSGQYATNRRSS